MSKKFLTLFAIIGLLVVSVFAFASCGGDAEPTTYTVTVKDNNGDAVANAKLVFSVGEETVNKTTDASGVATFETKNSGSVKITVTAPDGYKAAKKEYTFASGAKTLEISLTKLVAYTVTAKDQGGSVISGASFYLLVNGIATDTVVTDANGKAVFYSTPGIIVKAILEDIPAGYGFGGETEFDFASGASELTVDDIVKLTRCVITLVDQNGAAVVGANVQVCALDENGQLGLCATPQLTDASGNAVFHVNPAPGFKAQINSLPEGYTAEEMSRVYPDGETEITIIVQAAQ